MLFPTLDKEQQSLYLCPGDSRREPCWAFEAGERAWALSQRPRGKVGICSHSAKRWAGWGWGRGQSVSKRNIQPGGGGVGAGVLAKAS